MSDLIVYDNKKFAIGVVRDTGSQLIATNYKKGYAGYYSKNTNITLDHRGRIYCYGDGTTSLIREREHE